MSHSVLLAGGVCSLRALQKTIFSTVHYEKDVLFGNLTSTLKESVVATGSKG